MTKTLLVLLAAVLVVGACSAGSARRAKSDRRPCPESLASLNVPCEMIGNTYYRID